MDTTNINNSTHTIQSTSPATIQDTPDVPVPQGIDGPSDHRHSSSTKLVKRLFSDGWMIALKNILPVYVAIHIACFAITCLSVLFLQKDFAWSAFPLSTLWEAWHRWDVWHFIFIAQYGYDSPMRTAFFPLYPLLIRYATIWLTHNYVTAGLIVSSLAQLVVFVVLYRLVEEDIDADHAHRAVLYLAIFPTAFFLLAGYNESLFLCFSLLCFYNLRHANWWYAGLYGGLASLTRSAGLLLLLPYCYEYLVQQQFRLKNILRWPIVSAVLIPLGTALFAAYCYHLFHDPLTFSHAQADWNRSMHGPWHGIIISVKSIVTSDGFLSFQSLRNLTDLLPDLFVIILIALSFVGPWRLPYKQWSYGIYAIALLTLFLIFPNGGTGFYPLESTSRFMLEVFPAFIILAKLGKYRMVNLNYALLSGAIFFFLLTQFLTGHWVL